MHRFDVSEKAENMKKPGVRLESAGTRPEATWGAEDDH